VERQVQAIIGLCQSGLGPAELRDHALRRLRKVVPIDAAFLATVDPATLLFTSATADEPLGAATALFMENEFGRPDVNKFSALAGSHPPVSTLDQATFGTRHASPRYRDIMAPLSLGDELRAALVVGGHCWGVMCLHREDSPTGFTDAELRLVGRLVPHLAEALRRGLLFQWDSHHPIAAGPGIIVLDEDLTVVSGNREGEYWLDQLGPDRRRLAAGLPLAIHAVAIRAASDQQDRVSASAPRLRLRTPEGRWLVVHASRLEGAAGPQTAIVIEPAAHSELTSVILEAHGLTPAQSRVAALVLQGRSTRQIVGELAISANTVQEHLRAVFDKFGIGSRRELVAALLSGPHT
jgi:DNA-binding CsgD family transcriptional regulator